MQTEQLTYAPRQNPKIDVSTVKDHVFYFTYSLQLQTR